MKSLTLIASSASAIALMASAAIADNNAAFLSQTGGANSALIDQSMGSDNTAGRSMLANESVSQDGDDNMLVIEQSGDGNYAGANAALTQGQVRQEGGLNDLELTQSGDGNRAVIVRQTTGAAASLTPGLSGTNTASLVQSSDNNLVSNLSQTYSDEAGATPNTMSVTQSGGGTNQINLALQNGRSNQMQIEQDSTNNRINTARQVGRLNTMDVMMQGTDNGRGSLSGFAAASGAMNASLLQIGTGNDMVLDIYGRPTIPVPDANQFGITQIGNYNTVNAIELRSKRANLGIYQNGNSNEVQLAAIEGNDNNVGIIQLADDNFADVAIVGGNSTGNSFMIDQNGMSNEASVTIDGNNNGDGRVFGDPLSGQALFAASFSPNWERGVLRQIGNDNVASLTQYGSGNTFGTLQDGALNSISGMQDGVDNQVAVLQLGNGNSTTYSQVGTGNNAGIVQ